MSWKDKMIPGFIGQAMRTHEDSLTNIGSDESGIDLTVSNNKVNPHSLNLQKSENLIMETPIISTKPTISCTVITGKSSEILESKINAFLKTITSNQHIIDCSFASMSGLLHYTITVSTKTEAL